MSTIGLNGFAKIASLLFSPRNPIFSEPGAIDRMVSYLLPRYPVRFYITTTEQQRSSIAADEYILKPAIEELCCYLTDVLGGCYSRELRQCSKIEDILQTPLPLVDAKLSELNDRIFCRLLMQAVIKTREQVITLECVPHLENESKVENVITHDKTEEFIINLIYLMQQNRPLHVIFPMYEADKILEALQKFLPQKLPPLRKLKENFAVNKNNPVYQKLIYGIVFERIKTSLRIGLKTKNIIKNFNSKNKSLSELATVIANKLQTEEVAKNELRNSIFDFLQNLVVEMIKSANLYFEKEFPYLTLLQLNSIMHYPLRNEAPEIFKLMGILCDVQSFGCETQPVVDLTQIICDLKQSEIDATVCEPGLDHQQFGESKNLICTLSV